MKKLVHKNQIIITALAVMIVVAGYLNFTGQEIATGNILQKDAKQTQSTVKADGKKTDKKESKTTKVSKKGAKTTAKKADSKKDAVTKDISEEDSAKVTVNDNGEVVTGKSGRSSYGIQYDRDGLFFFGKTFQGTDACQK